MLGTTDIINLCLYCLIAVIGVSGNALVVKWFYVAKKRHMPGSIMVITLACNDVMASIIVPLIQIHNLVTSRGFLTGPWYLGKTFCHLAMSLYHLFLLTTSWLLVAIAAERYK